MKLFLFIFIIHEFWLPASLVLNVSMSLSNLLPPLASSWLSVLVSLVLVLLILVNSLVISVLLILVSTFLWAAFFRLPTSPHLPTANLTHLLFLYPCCCMNWCRLTLSFQMSPPLVVICDLSPLVPQFWFLVGHGHLTLSEIFFTNFVLPMQTVLQFEFFWFPFMNFICRKSWFNPSRKTSLVVILLYLSTFVDASLAKEYSLSAKTCTDSCLTWFSLCLTWFSLCNMIKAWLGAFTSTSRDAVSDYIQKYMVECLTIFWALNHIL